MSNLEACLLVFAAVVWPIAIIMSVTTRMKHFRNLEDLNRILVQAQRDTFEQKANQAAAAEMALRNSYETPMIGKPD